MPSLFSLFRRRVKPQLPYAAHERAQGLFGHAQEASIRYVEGMRAEKIEEEGERNLHERMQKKEFEELREMLRKYGFEPENIPEHINKLKTLKSLYGAGFKMGNMGGVVRYAREQLGIGEISNEKMLVKIKAILSDPSIAPFLR